MKTFILAVTCLTLSACAGESTPRIESVTNTEVLSSGATQEAIFAGGCFWCVEKDFEAVPGVIEAISGYSGGESTNPTYRNHSGHYEVVKVIFDPAQVSYEQLVDFYWTTVDPTDPTGQFCDKGGSYRTAVFADPDQLPIAKASLEDVRKTKPFSDPIVTPVLKAQPFYVAEDYHQDYYKTTSIRYRYYRSGCGRDARVKQLWGHKADWEKFQAAQVN